MYGTKNFTLETDPRLRCTCGKQHCDKRHVEQWVLERLQAMRDDLGQPIQITSGGRCALHPVEARKKKPGEHYECVAVDVRCTDDLMANKLMVLAGRHGATRIARGKTFLHIGWRQTAPDSVPTWRY